MARSLSLKARFEIFKRDGFVCQYCGEHPPKVTLEVDHIEPVCDGGSNEPDNLITACFACNRGKGAVDLREVPQSLKEKADEIAEREEQIRGYAEVMGAKRRRLNSEVDSVDEVFSRFHPGYSLSDSGRASVRMFIEKLGVSEVIDSMELAGSRQVARSGRIFKYFCGICWNKIKETPR